jgi:hypothetical protein
MTEDDQVTSTFHRAMKLRDEGAYEQAVGLFESLLTEKLTFRWFN